MAFVRHLVALCAALVLCACADKISNYYAQPEDIDVEVPPAPIIDTDQDGLSDVEEAGRCGTSPILTDTDGDGMSDYTECVELGFDPTTNPFRFNPLVADVPKLGVVLTSPPVVSLHLTDTEGASRTFETSRSTESANTVMTSTTDTNSHSVEQTHTATVEFGFSGLSLSGSVSYSYSNATTDETSHAYTEEQSKENRQAVSNAEGYEQSHDIGASGGILMVTAEFENRGNMSFRIDNIILSAVVPDPTQPGVFLPIGNLTLDASYTSFPVVTVAPGQRIGPLNFINDGLDLATAKMLLADARSLVIKPASFELTNAEGRAFAFNLTEVQAKTATIIIDYADKRPPERYMIATNTEAEVRGIAAGTALQDVLRIPFEAGTMTYDGNEVTGLLGLRADDEVRANESRKASWLVIHSRHDGIEWQITEHDMLLGDFNFASILLKAADVLHLVYIEDTDGDGIYSREEFLRGTIDGVLDSDGDGLADVDEILTYGTDPGNPDTDDDRLNDSVDPDPLLPNVFDLRVYNGHGHMVSADGALWAWGKNDIAYQLGLGDTDVRDVPTRVGTEMHWHDVAAGEAHGIALTNAGTLFTWGNNEAGQLGIPGTTVESEPTRLGADFDWVQVFSSRWHTHAIKANGSLWGWGGNDQGQVGDGSTTTPKASPTLIGPITDRWLVVSGGDATTWGIRADGTLWGWGYSEGGELGIPTLPPDTVVDAPMRLGLDEDWATVDAGMSHTLALKSDGSLWVWGYSPCGGGYGVPTAIGSGWREIAAGGQQSLAVKIDGTLWSWGCGEQGELGHGDNLLRAVPTQVGSDDDWVVVEADGSPGSSAQASFAVKADGTVWAWGRNVNHVLGVDAVTETNVPICVASVVPGVSCP